MTTDILNRSAVVLGPKQPYLEWARRDDEEGLAEDVFETLRSEPSVYLLPGWEDPEEERLVLEEFWPALFEAMLGAWVADERLWPKGRSMEMFREWFEVRTFEMVQDICLDEVIDYLE